MIHLVIEGMTRIIDKSQWTAGLFVRDVVYPNGTRKEMTMNKVKHSAGATRRRVIGRSRDDGAAKQEGPLAPRSASESDLRPPC